MPSTPPDESPHSLGDVLDRAENAAKSDKVTFGDLVEAMGQSSLTAILLLVSILIVTPLSGVPGVSVTGGVLIALVSVQIVIGRESASFPRWILNRSIPGKKMRKAVEALRKPANFADRHIHNRMVAASGPTARRVLGAICLALGLVMPALEFLPFTSSIAAATVALLALAMLAQDGLLALAAFGLLATAIAVITWLI